jgi:dTDP-glucose 4,6-dehydratase
VRIFNTYGPRMRLYDGRVVPTMLRQAIRGENLTVFGDGSQTRSFCYVSDLIEGIYALMLSDTAEPVNIGNPREMSILDFARMIQQITCSSGDIVFEDLPVDDPKVRQPDITRAQTILKWEPKIPVEEGLANTYAWMKARMQQLEQQQQTNHL